MNECKFCGGDLIPVERFGENGFRPMSVNLFFITGTYPENYGITLKKQEGHVFLCFDNSCGEYCEGQIEIKYCPFCGKELKAQEP